MVFYVASHLSAKFCYFLIQPDGVHFHDEIIVEDWTEATCDIHETTGQMIDAIPLF